MIEGRSLLSTTLSRSLLLSPNGAKDQEAPPKADCY